MRRRTSVISTASFLALLAAQAGQATATVSADSCATAALSEIHALFDRWNDSLATRHPDRVLRNYAADAIMIGLDINNLRDGFLEIRDHYVYFLQREPSAKPESRSIRLGCNTATDTGIQAMTLRPKAKAPFEVVKVRYSLSYEYRAGAWLIVHHHLSALPEPPKPVPGPVVAGFIKRAADAAKTVDVKKASPAKPAAAAPARNEGTYYRAGSWLDGNPVYDD